MKHKFVFSALVAMLVTGSAAFAQTTATGVGGGGVGGLSTNGLAVSPNGTAGLNSGFGVNNGFNTFNNGLGFNNSLGFNNLGFNNGLGSNGLYPNNQGLNTLSNGLGVNNGFTNFNNGLDIYGGLGTGLYPGYGYNNYGYNSYGYGGYGPSYSGPLVDVRSAWMNGGGGGMMRRSGWNGTGIPTLGVNVAPSPFRTSARVRVKLTQDPDETRVVNTGEDLDNQPLGEVKGGSTSPLQTRLASRLQDVMQDRPLREGKVLSINGSSAQVRYQADGEVRTARFPSSEVFLFQRNGSIATAATDPNLVKTGTQVLIPQPLIRLESQSITSEPGTIRESVAGSRQEVTKKSTTKRKTQRTHKTR